MPPRSKKTLARRPKIPFRRAPVDSSPSPPARKRRAATTPDARAKKLRGDGPSTYHSRKVEVNQESTSSSESSSLGDPMASSTPQSSSPSLQPQVEFTMEKEAESARVETQPTEKEKSVAESIEEREEQEEETVFEKVEKKRKKGGLSARAGIRDLPTEWFRSEQSKQEFYQGFHTRPVHIPRTIDFEFLEEHKFNFESLVTMQSWKHFLRRIEPIYHELVLLFHWNWDVKTFSSTVKGCKIELGATPEAAERKLGRILKIPYEEDQEVPTTATLFNTLSHSVKYSEGHTVMKTNELSIPDRLLRQFLCNCLLPKKGGTDTVTVLEAQLIWKMGLMRQISIPKLMLQSLAHFRGRINLLVPYGMWWTIVFRYFKIDLYNEPHKVVSPHERDFIGATMLKRMHIDVEAYKREREAVEQAEAANEVNENQHQGRNQGQQNAEAGAAGQNQDPGWYPGSWYDRIQGQDQSWVQWDGARSNLPTQASGPSLHPPALGGAAPNKPSQAPAPPAAAPAPPSPAHSNPPLAPTINLEEVSSRYIITQINALQIMLSKQFNTVHTTLAHLNDRLNILSEKQAALETNQLTLSAQIASLTSIPATSTVPPPPANDQPNPSFQLIPD